MLTCEGCGCVQSDVERYHQRTQYVNEEQNWVTLCAACRKQNDEYWDGMWADYYNNCM